MAIKKSDLYSSLWASCDELRGGMDASQYKDYVLVMLFIKYISDKWAGQPFAPITVPKGASFKDMVALKGKPDIGDQINKKIVEPIASANKLSDMPDFNDVNKLGSGKEMKDRLTNLIAIFERKELDFSKNRAEGDDLLGDAYEYLMRNFATESGKSKGQFYTPAEVSRTMAKLIGINDDRRKTDVTVYDPTCGSGSLLLRIANESERNVTLYGQEKESATAGLARMNMILHDNPTAEIKQGNTLANPLFEDQGNLKTFDFVVANPPFSDKRWSNGVDLPKDEPYNRFADFGVPPSKNGDYAYLLHIIRSLKRQGRGAVILPHGVLFRGNVEAEIRKNLIKKKYIKGIIGLPPNLFFGTGIPAAIIVIDKANAQNGIFMIDAGKGFIKDGNKNRLREQDIHKIADVFNNLREIPGYSRMVSLTEIEGNEYNLNIPRYIENLDKEDIQDIEAHLKGGIPNRDIDDLSEYWKVYPNMKQTLFKQNSRPNYSDLLVDKDSTKKAIFEHKEFLSFSSKMQKVFDEWKDRTVSYLKDLEAECNPKDVIYEISEDLLKQYTDKPLIDKYDIYQLLMDYWHEIMQDDLYIIAVDGWNAKTYRIEEENKKGNIVDKGWTSDLIPKYLVINRFFQIEKKNIDNLVIKKEEIASHLTEIEEENSSEEGPLKDVSNKTDAFNSLFDFTDLAIESHSPVLYKEKQNLEKELDSIVKNNSELKYNPFLQNLKNNKGNITKTAVKNRIKKIDNFDEKQILEDYLASLDSIKKLKDKYKSINKSVHQKIEILIKEDPAAEFIKEILICKKYIQLNDELSDIKKNIKAAEKELDEKLYNKYPQLTEDEIKQLVVDDKWMITIQRNIASEVDSVSQRLANRIRELAERYETPLPQINKDVSELESKVNSHLQNIDL